MCGESETVKISCETYIVGGEAAVEGLEVDTLPLCGLKLLEQLFARWSSILAPPIGHQARTRKKKKKRKQ